MRLLAQNHDVEPCHLRLVNNQLSFRHGCIGDDCSCQHYQNAPILLDEVNESGECSNTETGCRYAISCCRIEFLAQLDGEIQELLARLVKLSLYTLVLCLELIEDGCAFGIGFVCQVLSSLDVIQLICKYS